MVEIDHALVLHDPFELIYTPEARVPDKLEPNMEYPFIVRRYVPLETEREIELVNSERRQVLARIEITAQTQGIGDNLAHFSGRYRVLEIFVEPRKWLNGFREGENASKSG